MVFYLVLREKLGETPDIFQLDEGGNGDARSKPTPLEQVHLPYATNRTKTYGDSVPSFNFDSWE